MPYSHLLVPTDGSELSDKAVQQAVALAHSLGARITFFHAQSNFPISLVGVGELRIAGEMICDWLSEGEVALPRPLHAELLQVLAAVGVEELDVRFVPEAAP